VRQPTLLREAVNAATAALREREETLELRVQERTHELATLLHVSRTLASTLELEEVVDLVLDQLARVVEYVGARVWLVDGDEVILVGDRGPLRADARSSRASLRDRPLVNETYQSGAPIIVDDVRGDDNDRARAWRMREAAGALPPGLEYLRSWLGVPLVARDRVIGVISIGHDESAHFRPEHADIALAFATQAAIAIENARLYEEAQGRAALEERQRLARDLHDAVTQTLFSASLIAEVLPKIWQRDAIQGQARLDELRQLTRGALAEMRTLLLELRPTVLTETALPDLLRQLSEAFTGRARVPVDLRVEGEGSLPTDVQIALYRVAQESLHNVAKHAGATRVDVRLIHHPGGVQLSVEDDGRGFDPDAVPAGHLGVGIMRERAEAVGAAIEITSRPSAGTRVEVVWPAVADGADSDEHRAPYE
jgi:signal transduction histidine kinase